MTDDTDDTDNSHESPAQEEPPEVPLYTPGLAPVEVSEAQELSTASNEVFSNLIRVEGPPVEPQSEPVPVFAPAPSEQPTSVPAPNLAPVEPAPRPVGPPPLQVVWLCPVEITTEEVLARRERLERRAPELVRDLGLLLNTSGPVGCAFDAYRGTRENRVVFARSDSRHVWFLGDVHGDLVALEAALKHITATDPGSPIVFLGDLIDDGPDGYAVLLRLAELLVEDRHRIALVPGNHDVALRQTGRGFSSLVEPCEFATWLNVNRDIEAAQELGRLMIRFFDQCPRALFFEDGLLAAHGGFPHTDLHDSLRHRDDLNQEQCLNDFTWLRAHDKARRKDPNRNTSGCSFGVLDFQAFCQCMLKLNRRVHYFVRGHDHIEERYKIYPAYGNRLLTINTLSRRLDREYSFAVKEYTRYPCVARGQKGMLPEVHRLQIDPSVICALYPERRETPP